MHNLRALQILMVEDNEDHAELMAEAFHEFNVKNSIHHVENGEEALTYLRNESPYEDETRYPRPDIVFLDLRMPKMGGAETLQAIRADEDLKAIPVVMVSTSKTQFVAFRNFALGF